MPKPHTFTTVRAAMRKASETGTSQPRDIVKFALSQHLRSIQMVRCSTTPTPLQNCTESTLMRISGEDVHASHASLPLTLIKLACAIQY